MLSAMVKGDVWNWDLSCVRRVNGRVDGVVAIMEFTLNGVEDRLRRRRRAAVDMQCGEW